MQSLRVLQKACRGSLAHSTTRKCGSMSCLLTLDRSCLVQSKLSSSEPFCMPEVAIKTETSSPGRVLFARVVARAEDTKPSFLSRCTLFPNPGCSIYAWRSMLRHTGVQHVQERAQDL